MVFWRMSTFYNFYKFDKKEPDDEWDNKWASRMMEMEKINNKRISYSI